MTTDTLWFSPVDFVTGDSSLVVSYPAGMSSAVEITTTSPGDAKWIYLALKVPSSHEINALQVCYQLSNVGSFIAQIQLVEMQTPDVTVVHHDDSPGQAQLSIAATAYRSTLVDAFRPAGAILLALRLHFAAPTHTITLRGMGVEVSQVLTWNTLFERPELRGPISFSPGKPLRADTGFIHYGGKNLDWDFHTNPYDPTKEWGTARSTTAAWRILSDYSYPPYSDPLVESRHNTRFLPYNPYGTYALQLAIVRTSKSSAGGNYAKFAGLMYWDASAILKEEYFVHHGGGSDESHRVVWSGDANRYLMKFDDEDFFKDYIAPLIDNFYRDYPYATGAPAIFVDNCPGLRDPWTNVDAGWDHFATNDAWFAGWQQVFRLIKSKYPNLKIYANWSTDPLPPDDGADRVLELVDHILFENFYNIQDLKPYLAYAYRVQKLGKGVTFGRNIVQDSEPTLKDYSKPLQFDPDQDYKHAYFCAFLLTWGEHSHWNAQWQTTSNNDIAKIHDLEIFKKWFGVPSAGENGTDMWEMRPDLWTRNFVNAKVLLNVSDYNTYTIPLSEAVDENDAPVLSITLDPHQGQFVFRQSPKAAGFTNSSMWRQLPSFWRGPQSYPYSITCDAIVSSLNLGMGESNENWVSDSEDLTVTPWKTDTGTGVTKLTGVFWNGIQMNELHSTTPANPSGYGLVIRHPIHYGSSLAGKYVTIMCYAQLVYDMNNMDDNKIQGIGFAVDGAKGFKFYPLKWGDYPQLITAVLQISPTFTNSLAWLGIWGVPTTAKGKLRLSAIRVLISSVSDNPAIGEYIRTTGTALTRASGAGIGLPLHLVGLSGYLPANSRPQLPLLNRTQIVGLASGSGSSTERALLQDVDVGYQYFDTTLGLPLWWKGNSWITGDGTVVP